MWYWNFWPVERWAIPFLFFFFFGAIINVLKMSCTCVVCYAALASLIKRMILMFIFHMELGRSETFDTSHWNTFKFGQWRRAITSRNVEFQSRMVWIPFNWYDQSKQTPQTVPRSVTIVAQLMWCKTRFKLAALLPIMQKMNWCAKYEHSKIKHSHFHNLKKRKPKTKKQKNNAILISFHSMFIWPMNQHQLKRLTCSFLTFISACRLW